VGIDDGATHDVWRFLLGVDWVDRITAHRLPRDHPLPLLVDRFDRLRLSVRSALWLRLLDVRAALAGRSYATAGRVTVEVAADPLFPDNVGAWTIEDGAVRRARRRVDVRLAVDALASVYLGELTFHRLARAGRAAEVARGGVERADAAFRVALAPWAAENF
jgi:predicted acetyltransferase